MDKILINIILIFLFSQELYSQNWLSPWENRQVFTITNYNYVPMVDHQTRLPISYTAGMQSDFDDLRFTTLDGTLLSYWIEFHAENEKAIVWLEADYINPFSNKDFYMYYGNNAAESVSDPYETFVFYDDFEDDQGWNDIGPTSTAIVMYDSLTSTLHKYEECGANGAWKLIGDTLEGFKLITREFMPADSDDSCTLLEYGVEASDFRGVNLRRDANDTGPNTEFGLELRDGITTSNINTTLADQPKGSWVRTSLSFALYCHFNMHAMMFDDSMQVTGNVYGETFRGYAFDRFTIRGGHEYYMDYVAIANHLCVWPVVSWGEEESCPVGDLVHFEHDRCEEGLGEITIYVSGGVAPYNVTWFDGQDSLGTILLDTIGNVTIDSLSAGEYCFKIVDDQGCEN